jgi:hypothetical protein
MISIYQLFQTPLTNLDFTIIGASQTMPRGGQLVVELLNQETKYLYLLII